MKDKFFNFDCCLSRQLSPHKIQIALASGVILFNNVATMGTENHNIDYTLHTHTRGFDGRNTVEEMICTARARGFNTIGFSNHFIVHPYIKKSKMYEYAARGGYAAIYNDDINVAMAKFAAHYSEVRGLREKYPDMNILCGMEMDWFQYDGWRDMANCAVARLNPDYVIGAMHFIDRGADGILNVHDMKNADLRESGRLLREYYQNLMRLAEFDWRPMGFRFNWVAHFDLPRKVGLYYEDMENAALKTLALNNMPIELNTALMGRENYISQDKGRTDKIDQIAKTGIVTLASDDAHDVTRLGCDFDVVKQLVKSENIVNFCNNFNMLKQKVGVRSR